MGLKNINLWLPELRTKLTAVSDDLLLQELKAAVRIFAKDSGSYIIHVQNKDLKADKSTYYLNPQPEGNVLILWGVWYEGQPLPIYTHPPRTSSTPGNPHSVYSVSRGVIQFVPAPAKDESNVWAADVSVTPKDPAYVPEDYYDIWFDEIMDGALSRLYGMPKRPWTSPVSEKKHGMQFRNGISKARDFMHRKYSIAERPFKFPVWA